MSTLAEIFAKDPEHLTKDDLDEAIKAMRAARVNFNLGNKSAGTKRNTGASGGKKSLDDLLGGDL